MTIQPAGVTEAAPARAQASSRGPLSLLLDLRSVDWWDLKEALIDAIVRHRESSRIKSGLVLASGGSRTGSVTMSTYDPVRGRLLESSRQRSLPYFEERSFQRILREVEVIASTSEPITTGDLRRSECVSFSAVSDSLAGELVGIAAARGALVAGIRWASEARIAADGLWARLILSTIVTHDVVLVNYEEFPESISYDGSHWVPDRSPDRPGAGFFFNEGPTPNVDPSWRHAELPPDLDVEPLIHPDPTPLQQVIEKVGRHEVLRISGHDDADAEAFFELPDISFQYPDLLEVERKVRDYCLNRRHPLGKWVGFMRHGYGVRADDSTVLASHLAGALLGAVSPREVVATALGELQFAVQLAVPSRATYFMPVTTAWIAEPETGFRLSTAYVERTADDLTASVEVDGPGEGLVEAWDQILERAHERPSMWTSDGALAAPAVYIPRSGATGELTRQLVRRGDTHGTFRRSALGGPCLLVPLGSHMSWSEAAYITFYTQIQLGLRGVRTLSGLWVD